MRARARTVTTLVGSALALLAAGCADEPLPTAGFVTPTAISVDPQSFLGDVTCADLPGAMHAYVATVTDVTASPAFTLPSSAPIPCSQVASFRFVLAGHEYIAQIDAYETPAADLEPFGGKSSGSRVMLLEGTDTPAVPRWTTTCDTEVAAAFNVDVAVAGCKALEDTGVTGDTAVFVDPLAALDDLTCADGASEGDEGDVASFDVVPEGLPAVLGLACDPSTAATCPGPTCYGSLTPGVLYSFRIRAHRPPDASNPDGEIGWSAACSAVAKAGLTVPAVCDPLRSSGAITIAADQFACPDGATLYRACETPCNATSLTTPFVECNEDLRLEPIAPGPHTIEIRTQNEDDPPLATCTADVPAGEIVAATCMAP